MAFPKKERQPTWFITVSYRTPHDILPYIPADFDILILQLCHTVTEHVVSTGPYTSLFLGRNYIIQVCYRICYQLIRLMTTFISTKDAKKCSFKFFVTVYYRPLEHVVMLSVRCPYFRKVIAFLYVGLCVFIILIIKWGLF